MTDRDTALSVLNQWSDDLKENSAQLKRYFDRHDWLRADIEKLAAYIRRYGMRKVAITDCMVYGIDRMGTVCITGRGNLYIPPNFS